MNEKKQLYEIQYGEKKLVSVNSFPFLRKVFKKYDLHREDLVFSFLDGGERLPDVGYGLLMFKVRDKFRNFYLAFLTSDICVEAKKKK